MLIKSGYPAHGFPAQILHEGCEGFLRKPDPSTIQPFDIVPGLQAGLPGKGGTGQACTTEYLRKGTIHLPLSSPLKGEDD